MNDDKTFALFCWFLILFPFVMAIATGNYFWLLGYIVVGLIFGFA